jgi:hypothetical protein
MSNNLLYGPGIAQPRRHDSNNGGGSSSNGGRGGNHNSDNNNSNNGGGGPVDPRLPNTNNQNANLDFAAPARDVNNAGSSLGATMPVAAAGLPPAFVNLFSSFASFNAMQTKCFDTFYRSDDNVCVTAPTGAGKTVLFELALIRFFHAGGRGKKALYVAPTK